MVIAQESFGKFEAVHPQTYLGTHDETWIFLDSIYLSSPYEVPPALSGNSAHAAKFVAKIYVEVFFNNMVNPPYHFFAHRIAHHSEFAIADKGGKGGG